MCIPTVIVNSKTPKQFYYKVNLVMKIFNTLDMQKLMAIKA